MLQKPKYHVSCANVFASRNDVSSYRNFVPARAILFPWIQFITDYIARCIRMPGRIILSEYVRPIQAWRGQGGLNLSHFILRDYARVKLGGEIFTIAELVLLRRIVKLRALTPTKTCLLRGIADGEGEEGPRFVPLS